MTIKFDMKVEQHYASFFDKETKDFVAVESFDNKLFEVRLGELSESKKLGTVYAKEDGQLNAGLFRLVAPHLKRPPAIDLSKDTIESLDNLALAGLENSCFIAKLLEWRTAQHGKPAKYADPYLMEITRLAIEYLEKRQSELENNHEFIT